MCCLERACARRHYRAGAVRILLRAAYAAAMSGPVNSCTGQRPSAGTTDHRRVPRRLFNPGPSHHGRIVGAQRYGKACSSRTLLRAKPRQRRSQRCIGGDAARHDKPRRSSGDRRKPPKRELRPVAPRHRSPPVGKRLQHPLRTPGSERAACSVLRFFIRRRKLGILAADHGRGSASLLGLPSLASRSIAGPPGYPSPTALRICRKPLQSRRRWLCRTGDTNQVLFGTKLAMST